MVTIPFTSEKETFTCQLGDFRFRFRALFNDVIGVWHFDLSDAQTGVVIAYQIPVLLGQDLLAPFNLDLGSIMAADMSAANRDAGPDDLGTRVVVFYFTPEEWEAL